MSGYFISFEGGEGCGKSSHIEPVANLAQQRFYTAPIVTREPGGTPAGELIRKTLLSSALDCSPSSELLLFVAQRVNHIDQKIYPALHEDKLVLTDRFRDSTRAYQGFGRYHNNPEWVAEEQRLHARYVKFMPDKTFFFDVEPEVGLKRALSRNSSSGIDEGRIFEHSFRRS